MTAIDTGTDKMLAHVEDGIGWMTYNNPARLNAMSYDMQIAVPRILGAFAADPEVHVIVVRGAGEKAFVSGADISEFSDKRTTVAARADYDEALARAWGSWRLIDTPIIAMIRGYCIGGGLLTAMNADIRIAAEGSQFGVPAAKLGLGYAYGGVEELMSLVGPAWAAEILFSARRLDADEALRIGLVNAIADPVLDRALEAAHDLAAKSSLALALAKRLCNLTLGVDHSVNLETEADEFGALFASADAKEGLTAFVEKRPPKFSGR